MAIKTANSLFFTNNKASMNDHPSMGCQTPIKSLAWFAQMARAENLSANEIDAVLGELANFFDEKETEKEETIAELQLAEAYKEVLADRLVVIRSVKHGMK